MSLLKSSESLILYVISRNTRMDELLKNYSGDYQAKRKKFNKITNRWNEWYSEHDVLPVDYGDEEIDVLTTLWLDWDSAVILGDKNPSYNEMGSYSSPLHSNGK